MIFLDEVLENLKLNNMEEIFNKHKGTKIMLNGIEYILCGYNSCHFLLAVKSRGNDMYFGNDDLKQETFLLDEFKTNSYQYYYCDEKDIIDY